MMAPERICPQARKAAKPDAGTSGEPADADCGQIRPALRVAVREAPAGGSMPADVFLPRLNRTTPLAWGGLIHPMPGKPASGSDHAAGLADGRASPPASAEAKPLRLRAGRSARLLADRRRARAAPPRSR